MKVVYTAPNRSHHYRYAAALNAAGCLYAFVSGFPRLSPRAKAPELVGKLYRSDFLQTLYIFSLKANFPGGISRALAFFSKVEQDFASRRFVRDCDIFLFYNGCGLFSGRHGRKTSVINIVEAVNSHVEYQENLLRQEYEQINLTWKPFPENEKRRRLQEYKEADYILLPSEFVKRSFLEKGFQEHKLLKVPYGFNNFNSPSKSNKLKSKSDGFTILYVGSVSVRKGMRYLVKAFQKLNKTNKRLLIVGPDTRDGALNGIDITSDIIFTGILKGKKLEEAYQSADVFCLPSIEEGLALVIGEAISFGLPIIATYNTGADDIIVDGHEGYLVPIRDSEAIWEKLEILAGDPEILERMRSSSYSKSKELNGWEDTGKNLINALRKVLKDKHS